MLLHVSRRRLGIYPQPNRLYQVAEVGLRFYNAVRIFRRRSEERMIPIYRTKGDWVAVYVGGHLFNVDGEWLGFVIGREVFDPAGAYFGFLSDDQRLLRKRTIGREPPHYAPPPRPSRPKVPPTMPLSPLMRELPFQIIDMFEEFPERLMYISETRPDMD